MGLGTRWPWIGSFLVTALLAVTAPPAVAGGGRDPRSSQRAARRILLTVVPHSAAPIPASFLGLSAEYPALPTYLSARRPFERVLSQLQVPGDGPLLLRIGGDSADRTYWDPGSFRRPLSSTVLTQKWFLDTASLVRDLGLRVAFDLNVRHSTPDLSARLAYAALFAMPAGSVYGFEVGNEPNRYRRGYTADHYARDFRSFLAPIPAAPGLLRMGPANGDSGTTRSTRWLSRLITGDSDMLDVLTAHRYPLRACDPPGSPLYPTIPRLLSERTATDMRTPIKGALRLAHRAHLLFRLDEFNSVTCGGRRGVSDTFATALWSPDALFQLLRMGVDGVNLHMRPEMINGPMAITRRAIRPRPLLYGLMLFVRTLGPDGRLVRLLSGPRPAGLEAWGVRVSGNRLHVLVVNKSGQPRNVFLRVSSAGNAAVERLLAPSAQATSNVTLAGQRLGPDGLWKGRRVVQTVGRRSGGYDLQVRGYSAALVSLRLY